MPGSTTREHYADSAKQQGHELKVGDGSVCISAVPLYGLQIVSDIPDHAVKNAKLLSGYHQRVRSQATQDPFQRSIDMK